MSDRAPGKTIRIRVTDDECRGLTWIADSFGEHLREGLVTGDEADDQRALAACAWIGRVQNAYARAAARKG